MSSKKLENKTPVRYVKLIIELLYDFFGNVETPLTHKNTEQLTVAVVLSAQTTDDQVNKVTPVLFENYPDMKSLAEAPLSDIEKIIFSTGFYKNKAKHIKALAQDVVNLYDGKIPNDFEALLKLPGVGRKTANVVMDCAFQRSVGIVVDTHVKRISQRLHLTKEKSPDKIEKDLMKIIPEKEWKHISLQFIYLGRKFCMARKPTCIECILKNICPSADVSSMDGQIDKN